MRILVTGSRNWSDVETIRMALGQFDPSPAILTIVHGGASGADSIAEQVARKYYGMDTEIHRPNYNVPPEERRIAPLKRNDFMLDSNIDLVLAFMLGTPEKGGTLYTVNGAKKRRLPVVIYNWPGDVE